MLKTALPSLLFGNPFECLFMIRLRTVGLWSKFSVISQRHGYAVTSAQEFPTIGTLPGSYAKSRVIKPDGAVAARHLRRHDRLFCFACLKPVRTTSDQLGRVTMLSQALAAD